MKTHEVLERAAAVLLEGGLWKGNGVDVDGNCILLAVVRAGSIRALSGAEGYIGTALGFTEPFDSGDIIAWNDRPETTFDMVYGALLEGARLAKEAES